jgi:hypothetical protein
MADGAARAGLRLRQTERLGDPAGTGIDQDGVGFDMKVFPAPGDILAAFGSGTAMTAGGLAAQRANKRSARFSHLARLFGKEISRAKK